MSFRVTEQTTNTEFTARVNSQRSHLSILQERITTGKRINRPSDDPGGAEVVLSLRTSQTEITQFQRNAQAASQKLTASDDGLGGYQSLLERSRTLLAQGLTGTTTQAGKNAIAAELESIRSRLLNVANSRSGDAYVFGGTRQDVPPYDPATATAAATPASPQYIQIEPGANAIAVGVTADTVFADSTATVFADLNSAVTALRGTGNAAADQAALVNTNNRLSVYSGLINNARAVIGANTNSTESAQEALTSTFQSLEERASGLEEADFAQTAIDLASGQKALEASLQVVAASRRSLFDYLG